jgi:hypothetical protein
MSQKMPRTIHTLKRPDLVPDALTAGLLIPEKLAKDHSTQPLNQKDSPYGPLHER